MRYIQRGPRMFGGAKRFAGNLSNTVAAGWTWKKLLSGLFAFLFVLFSLPFASFASETTMNNQNHAQPVQIEYLFADEYDSVSILGLLSENGVAADSVENVSVCEGSEENVRITFNSSDCYVSPVRTFDRVVLSVASDCGDAARITLHCYPALTVSMPKELSDVTLTVRGMFDAEEASAKAADAPASLCPDAVLFSAVIDYTPGDPPEGGLIVSASSPSFVLGSGEKLFAVVTDKNGVLKAGRTVSHNDDTIKFYVDSFSQITFVKARYALLADWRNEGLGLKLYGYGVLPFDYHEITSVPTLDPGTELLFAAGTEVASEAAELCSSCGLSLVLCRNDLEFAENESLAVFSLSGESIAEAVRIGSSVALGASSGFALVRDTGYRSRNIELGGVTVSGMLPKDAEAEALYVSDSVRFEGKEVLAAYDISITEDGIDYQPDEAHPVLVRIACPGLEYCQSIEVRHIRGDGSFERVGGLCFDYYAGTVSFTAAELSVYAVVGVRVPGFSSDISSSVWSWSKSGTVTFDLNSATASWNETDPAYVANGSNQYVLTDPDPSDYEPAEPTCGSLKFIGWVKGEVFTYLGKTVPTAADWSGFTPGKTGTGENYINDLAYIKANLWDFNDAPPTGEILYAVWSTTVTVTFNLEKEGILGSLEFTSHEWNDTDSSYYISNGVTSPNYDGDFLEYTVTLPKGDLLRKPADPTYHELVGNHFPFLYWLDYDLVGASYTNYTEDAVMPNAVLPYSFDFSVPVTTDKTLSTSWFDAQEGNVPMYLVTFTKSAVDPLNHLEQSFEFQYTIKTWYIQESSAPVEDTASRTSYTAYLKDGDTISITLYYWGSASLLGSHNFYYQTVEIAETPNAAYNLTFSGTAHGTASGTTFTVDPFTGKMAHTTAGLGARHYYRYNNENKYFRVSVAENENNLWLDGTAANSNPTSAPDIDGETTFVNTRKTETVTVEKSLISLNPSNSEAFVFTVGLYNLNGSTPVTGYDMNSGGTAITHGGTFSLSGGGTQTLNIPYGAKLVVTETLNNDYTVETDSTEFTDADGVSTDEDFTIAHVTDDGTVEFTNTHILLTVSKTVNGGAMGSVSYTFEIHSLPAGTYYSQKYSTSNGAAYTPVGSASPITVDSGGILQFSLQHNQKIVLEIPYSSSGYDLYELNASSFTVSVTENGVNTNASVSGSDKVYHIAGFTGDLTLDVLNDRIAVAPTGFSGEMRPFVWMTAAGLLLFVIMAAPALRRRREDEETDLQAERALPDLTARQHGPPGGEAPFPVPRWLPRIGRHKNGSPQTVPGRRRPMRPGRFKEERVNAPSAKRSRRIRAGSFFRDRSRIAPKAIKAEPCGDSTKISWPVEGNKLSHKPAESG